MIPPSFNILEDLQEVRGHLKHQAPEQVMLQVRRRPLPRRSNLVTELSALITSRPPLHLGDLHFRQLQDLVPLKPRLDLAKLTVVLL